MISVILVKVSASMEQHVCESLHYQILLLIVSISISLLVRVAIL